MCGISRQTSKTHFAIRPDASRSAISIWQMAKVELTAQNRSAGVGSQQPADAFRKTVPPALAEGPFFDRPMGSANGIGQWDRPMGSANGIGQKGAEKAGRRTMFSLKARGGPPLGGANSRRRKTPLGLPRKLSGERRKGPGFAQPPERGPLPRRERQRGSPSQGAAGHPLERQRRSCDAELDIRGFARSKTRRVQPRDLRSSVSMCPIPGHTSNHDSAIRLHVAQSAHNRRF